jgi:hypothetical protein
LQDKPITQNISLGFILSLYIGQRSRINKQML